VQLLWAVGATTVVHSQSFGNLRQILCLKVVFGSFGYTLHCMFPVQLEILEQAAKLLLRVYNMLFRWSEFGIYARIP
jgi:hypothetical protein